MQPNPIHVTSLSDPRTIEKQHDAARARSAITDRPHYHANRRTLLHLIDKYNGPDAEDVIAFLSSVWRGDQKIKARAPGPTEDVFSYAAVPEVFPTIKERITAAEILLAYRHGKAGATSDRAGDQTVPGEVKRHNHDLSRLSLDQLMQLETLLTVTAPVIPEETDAEIVESSAQSR